MLKLSVKGMAAACAILWGGAVFFGGLIHMFRPSYGGAFLAFAASIYPGYSPEGGFVGVLVGTAYALIDAGIGGALLAWIHNRLAN